MVREDRRKRGVEEGRKVDDEREESREIGKGREGWEDERKE